MSTPVKWLVRIVAAVLVIVVGSVVAFRLIGGKADKKLTIDSGNAAAVAGPAGIDGTWTATSDSVVGYRVNEVLSFGGASTKNVADGRTNKVTGALTASGSTVSAVELTVDMASITSNRPQRDQYFRGRIMNVASYPTSTFTLTKPITLDKVPTDTSVVKTTATGDLTIHGVTRSVTFPLNAERAGATIRINGEIPVVFADYRINDPSGGPASTEDHGLLEFTVVFARA